MDTQFVYSLFQQNGGKFSLSLEDFIRRLHSIKAFVFDWDGVFNTGQKSSQFPSTFLEADSMGLNMLRFGYWLTHHHTQAYCAIITGANNEGARKFVEREHMHEVFFSFSNKEDAIHYFCTQYTLEKSEICYLFDDVNDIGIAKDVGLRIQIPRPGSLLFNSYVESHSCRDYLCAQSGGEFAVRESCELILGMYGIYDEAITLRSTFHESYLRYWKERQGIPTRYNDGKSWNNKP